MVYKDYSSDEDFIMDESFKKFVERSDNECIIYWEKWIKNNPERRNNFNNAFIIVKGLLNKNDKDVSTDKAKSLKKLYAKINNIDKPHSISLILFRIAAGILLIAGLSLIIYVLDKINTPQFFLPSMNEITVPDGEKSEILLSDGTRVSLNSGTIFKYPTEFNSSSREVFLTGEAYFEVTKQNGAVFKVNTENTEINVLGTVFNVRSYPAEKRTTTTVVKGSVSVACKNEKIDPVVIKPNQMAIVSERKKLQDSNSYDSLQVTILSDVNTLNITSWKDHFLIFEDETFEEIAFKMERWYGIRIIIEDERLKKERYNGKFEKQSIYQVLDIIKTTTPIKYYVEKDSIRITLDNS